MNENKVMKYFNIKQALSVYFFHHPTVIEDSTAPFLWHTSSGIPKNFTHPKSSTIKIIPLKPTFFHTPLPSYYTVKKYLTPPTPSNMFPKRTIGGNWGNRNLCVFGWGEGPIHNRPPGWLRDWCTPYPFSSWVWFEVFSQKAFFLLWDCLCSSWESFRRSLRSLLRKTRRVMVSGGGWWYEYEYDEWRNIYSGFMACLYKNLIIV